jgi:glycosyltransferase involved in cell wall biosynthesis
MGESRSGEKVPSRWIMSTQPPLLSVIVANYNNERYLAGCLESVLEQTARDLEVVAYDDGSTDGSLAVIEDFAHRHPGAIRVMHDPVNRGVAFARHQAVLAARGEYITTLDSDDLYYNPQKLEKELALIQKVMKEEGKEIIAFSNVMLLKNDDPPCLWGTSENIRRGMIACEILSRSCFIPRDFIMKREWYSQAGGYDTRFKIYEDWDLKIRLAFRHEFHYTGFIGTAYRRHDRSLSACPFSEQISVLREIFEKNLSLAASGEREAIRRAFEEWMANQGSRSS